MFYITGDVHGQWDRLADFCSKMNTTKEDVLIILGDVGVNYFGGSRDVLSKKYLSSLDITLFCIHGNHEIRFQNLPGYKPISFCGATAYVESQYPNIIFAKDGQIYDICGKRCIVIGGAYSVDKPIRLQRGWGWWPDEQPSESVKKAFMEQIEYNNYSIDVVLSHTCPYKYIPTEAFIPGVDQASVDSSTERWLDRVENLLNYSAWYCGHYHISKKIDKLQFMFTDFQLFE